MSGFGTAPLGETPFGFGVGDAAPEPPTVASAACRALDQRTRDYTIDETTGHLTQTTPVRQRVQLRLGTELTSALADPSFGLGRPAKMGDTFAAEIEALVYQALHQEIEVEKVVRIVSIETTRGSRRAATHVRYVDLTTGTEHEARV